jgi:hypothetical protein
MDYAKKCRKIFQVEKSENQSISSICSGQEAMATYQKLDTDAMRCAPEPGAAEIIVDRAGYEDGQKVEKRVKKN